MSTKTLRKRIALVAVSAVGFGLLSSVAANASVTIDRGTTNYYNAGSPVLACSALANDTSDANQVGEYLVGGVAKFSKTGSPATGTTAGDKLVFSLTGPASFSDMTVGGTPTFSNNGLTMSVVSDGTSLAGPTDFKVKFSAVGTVQLTITKVESGTSTDIEQYTVTVVSACSTNNPSVANSFVKTSFYSHSASATVPSSNVTDSTAAVTTLGSASLADSADRIANGGKAYIDVRIMDGQSTPAIVTSAGTFSASATNGAVVSWSNSSSLQASTDSEIVAAGNQFNRLTIWQGDANKDKAISTTVTISYNGVVYGVRTITFTGKAASIKIDTANSSTAKAADTGKTALVYEILDGAGNKLTSAGPGVTGASSSGETNTPLVATSGTVVDATQAIVTSIPTINTEASGYVGTADVTCGTGSGTAAVYLKYTFSDLTSIKTDNYNVACAYTAVNYTAKLDKSSYAPGEIATLTISATDKNGKAVYDVDSAGNALALGDKASNTPAVSLPQMTAVLTPTYTDTFSGGVKKYKFTVGSTEGNYSGVVDLPTFDGTTYSQTAVTVTYKVDSGTTAVSNADVLAAIVKLIASINKQIAALQKALTKKK